MINGMIKYLNSNKGEGIRIIATAIKYPNQKIKD
jgi:hypothetical protein